MEEEEKRLVMDGCTRGRSVGVIVFVETIINLKRSELGTEGCAEEGRGSFSLFAWG